MLAKSPPIVWQNARASSNDRRRSGRGMLTKQSPEVVVGAAVAADGGGVGKEVGIANCNVGCALGCLVGLSDG